MCALGNAHSWHLLSILTTLGACVPTELQAGNMDFEYLFVGRSYSQ
jgi:hypothetical protein